MPSPTYCNYQLAIALREPEVYRWRLVQSVLTSIQQETLLPTSPSPTPESIIGLDPWTQSLVGVIQLDAGKF
jgi:hypothetical protein